MSDLDLSAAVEAGGKALADMARDWYCPKHPNRPRYTCEWCLAEVAIAAAAPLIEAQVRAQVATDIRTARRRINRHDIDPEITDLYDRGHLYGMSVAARIAAGGECS